jgi:2-polyprenyl-3-methyl-5-hydroxy-6-metoxy-1,4-benzoquinol methylase
MIDLFDRDLRQIDAEMASISPSDVPHLFKKIPLDIFGELLLDIPSKYPNIKAFFPSMASEQVQKDWTGAHGNTLLLHSTAFVKTLLYGYAEITAKNIENAKILDFGCGWGRIIRLLYKFTSFENIYAVDPWDESIKQCKEHSLKANMALSEWVPKTLPFLCYYDLIYALSVFTHLSEKTAHIALRTLRNHISEEGVLVITIRPKEYWYIHNEGKLASDMVRVHDEKGFAYTPHNLPPIENDITYGDTSISIDYLNSNFPQWRVVCVDYNLIDPYQVILFLKPA